MGGKNNQSFIDYFVSDPIATPPSLVHEEFSEKIVFLPYSYFINSHKYVLPSMIVRVP